MKPHLLKVSLEPETSFNILQKKGPNFYNQWHFHPEIELIYIHKGCGTRFIGDNVARFEPDELILLGSNLIHMWKCDPEYFLSDSDLKVEVTIIYFHPDFLGDRFFYSPELKNIYTLLEKAQRGIKVTGEAKRTISELISKIHQAQGVGKLTTLLTILDNIAQTREKQYINAAYQPIQYEEAETDRLNKIFHYTVTNFQQQISLNEIAQVANLSTKAFCRYFKSKTRKTYNYFLLEIRIAHACKLLARKDVPIYDACYESGFNNLSNFNRHFKKFMNKTPMKYKMEQQDINEQ